MCLTDEKFRQLREILNNDDDDWEYFGDINIPAPSLPSTVSSEVSAPVTRNKKRSNTESGEGSGETRFGKSRSATGNYKFVMINNYPYFFVHLFY